MEIAQLNTADGVQTLSDESCLPTDLSKFGMAARVSGKTS